MYAEPREMLHMNRFAGQKLRHRWREQTGVISGEREGRRDKIGVGIKEVQTTMYKINQLQG